MVPGDKILVFVSNRSPVEYIFLFYIFQVQYSYSFFHFWMVEYILLACNLVSFLLLVILNF